MLLAHLATDGVTTEMNLPLCMGHCSGAVVCRSCCATRSALRALSTAACRWSIVCRYLISYTTVSKIEFEDVLCCAKVVAIRQNAHTVC